MRKLVLFAVLAALALAAVPTSASATTWSGSCDESGTLFLSPSYKVVPDHHDYEAVASGTCTGTLDGHPYDGPAHVHIDGRMNKPMSCFAGFSNGVPGVMTFGSDPDAVDATRLDIVVNEFHVGPQLNFEFGGAYNGVGFGRMIFDVDQAALEACLGDGIDSVEITIENQTITQIYG